jgi:flagellar biosynthesis protein FliR
MSAEVFDALTTLGLQGLAWMQAALLVMARVGAFFALLPAFGERVVPMRIRLALALAMTMIVAPAVLPAMPATAALGQIAHLLVIEAAIGLAMGAALRLFVFALQIAGTIAAQATSLAQFFGGAGVDPQPAISQLLVMAGLALLVMAGLPEHAAQFLILGYILLPPGLWPEGASLAAWGVAHVGHAFGLAFVLAAPFVIGSAVYNLALGAINKAMPQLMVAFIGAPAITLASLALLMLAAPVMMAVWLDGVGGFLADPFGMP